MLRRLQKKYDPGKTALTVEETLFGQNVMFYRKNIVWKNNFMEYAVGTIIAAQLVTILSLELVLMGYIIFRIRMTFE